VEELLAARGIIVSHETVQQWVLAKLGRCPILVWRRMCREESRGMAVGWRVANRGGDYQIRRMQNLEHSAEVATAVDLNEEPMVCGLSAGGKWIRTFGSWI